MSESGFLADMRGRAPAVVQAAAWYPPHDLGGTEIYLEGLVEGLDALGMSSDILVPRHPSADATYMHRGRSVATYPVGAPASGEMRRGTPHAGFDAFLAALRQRRSAIYHQHSWTRGCGLPHLRAARELGMRTVLTVHVPSNLCLRGTMVRFGAEPCSGKVEARSCGACWAASRGVGAGMAKFLASLPEPAARAARLLRGRAGTALSARAIAARKAREVVDMARHADRIVAVCQWLHDALVANGIPREKLILSRQGVADAEVARFEAVARARRPGDGPLRLLFLGRWDPVKGLDVLVRAVRALPDAPLALTVRAVRGASDDGRHEGFVRSLAAGDPRITFMEAAPRAALPGVFSEHDVLAVPSTWLETGPLVVLEAQAAGLFVLGSRRGGIAELVDESDAGALAEAGNADAWAQAIRQLVARHRSEGLPQPKRNVRAMSEAAAEMRAVYAALSGAEHRP